MDAPLRGSPAVAAAGELEIFPGGGTDQVAAVLPVLSRLGNVIHAGPNGSGQAAKLVASTALFSVIAALGESLQLAETLRLSPEVTNAVLAATPLAEQATKRRALVEPGDYPPQFALHLAAKIAALVAESARTASLPVTRAAGRWLQQALRDGRGDEDFTAVLAQIPAAAGGSAVQIASRSRRPPSPPTARAMAAGARI